MGKMKFTVEKGILSTTNIDGVIKSFCAEHGLTVQSFSLGGWLSKEIRYIVDGGDDAVLRLKRHVKSFET